MEQKNEEQFPNNFLRILWDVVHEKAVFIKTQQPRLILLWQQLWPEYLDGLPKMRSISLERGKFINDIKYRANILRELQHAMKEGYEIIRYIVNFFFFEYFEKIIDKTFSSDDLIAAKFKIAETLLGSLLDFILVDRTPIAPEYIIVVKFKSLMKIRPVSIERMLQSLRNSSIYLDEKSIEAALKSLKELGYIKENTRENGKEYSFIGDFNLSPEGNGYFEKKLKPILEWAIGLWRTLYNIRSLDTPVPLDYPQRDSLQEIVSRAATQGFTHAYNVMENLADYFDFITSNNLTCP